MEDLNLSTTEVVSAPIGEGASAEGVVSDAVIAPEEIGPGKKEKKYAFGSDWKWFLFIIPVVLGVLIFSLYPMIMSIWYSFFKYYDASTNFPSFYYNGHLNFTTFNFVRLFKDMFEWKTINIYDEITGDIIGSYMKAPSGLHALWVTVKYGIITIPGSLILSFGIALMMNIKIKGIGFFRIMYYLPVTLPGAISGMFYADLFNVNFGLANHIFELLGLPRNAFLTGEDTAFGTVLATNLWGLGGGMLLWLSAFKNVPESLIEAAKIDGANAFVRLFKITIPMCSSIIFYNLITSMIGVLQIFSAVLVLYGANGPPGEVLNFFALKIYIHAFGGGTDMGYACTLAWFLFLIIAALTAITFKRSGWVYYEDGGNG